MCSARQRFQKWPISNNVVGSLLIRATDRRYASNIVILLVVVPSGHVKGQLL